MDSLLFIFQVGIAAFNVGTLTGLLLALLVIGPCHRKRPRRIAQDARGERRPAYDPSENPTRER